METVVAVIGGSTCSPEESRIAEAVGRELALRGIMVACGGLGGVMEAAARGAYLAGGVTIGILPGNSREEANPYIRIPIVTGMGYARNAILVKSAQAVIAIGGAFGTLSEIAFALQYDLPVVGINTWSLCRNGKEQNCIVRAEGAEEAVEKALSLMGKVKTEKARNG